jgi:general stress protein YciG
MTNDNDDQSISGNRTTTPDSARKLRGFAAMDTERVIALAKRGGEAAHRAGTAHQFTADEARIAGRKGGIAVHAKRRTSTPPSTPA